ncbi:MAG: hypothetical protein L0H96_13685 [Humibacillus sp.]|nr:hypothetical protein [Humibacillus sp.]MDN5777951.1 hypothetical protein [Humibacillus sp.]
MLTLDGGSLRHWLLSARNPVTVRFLRPTSPADHPNPAPVRLPRGRAAQVTT